MTLTQIGRNIIILRRREHLTQKQFADSLNISAATVSKWEKGKSEPSHRLVKKICQTYSVDPNFMYEKNNDVNDEKVNQWLKALCEELKSEELLVLAKEIINQYLMHN